MECRESQEVLTDYAFDELAPERRGQVEEHLHGCEACWRELLEIRRAVELAGAGSAAPPAGEDLRRRIRASLEREYGLSLRGLLAARIPVYVALGALTAGVLLALWLGRWAGRPGEERRAEQVEQAPRALVLEGLYDSTRAASREVF